MKQKHTKYTQINTHTVKCPVWQNPIQLTQALTWRCSANTNTVTWWLPHSSSSSPWVMALSWLWHKLTCGDVWVANCPEGAGGGCSRDFPGRNWFSGRTSTRNIWRGCLQVTMCSSYDLWHTDRQTDRQLLNGYTISSVSSLNNRHWDRQTDRQTEW